MARRPGASDSIRYGMEELKFLRSLDDVRILRSKIAYKRARRVPPREGGVLTPPSLFVEPTNMCNLRCVTCPSARSSAPRGHMDRHLFTKVVSEAADIGVQRIHLFLRGEPLLHPRIVEMVAFIKEKGLPVHLTTNGTRLTPELGAALLGAGVNSADQFTVSFIGHSKAGHEATMAGVHHDAVVDNVLAFVEARRRLRVNGPVTEVILNPTAETRGEADDFLRFWRGRVDHARIGGVSMAFQEYKREAALSIRRRSPCTQLYERMPVTWDGKVPQCNVDFDGDRIVGDLNLDTILEVWNSSRLQELRRLHREGRFEEVPECWHCDM